MGAILLVGCDAAVDSFSANEVYALTLARSRDVGIQSASGDVRRVVAELFGTPDHPRWPAEWVEENLQIDPANLDRAAGPQLSEQDGTHLGLFREHCVICHSVSGSGRGPASVFQNPYPRDFRPGVFKWKSTTRQAKPTRDDLRSVLHQGVAGSGMPSFSRVQPSDLEALVDYVIYLSVRGETERKLLAAAVDDLGYGEDQIDQDARLAVPATRLAVSDIGESSQADPPDRDTKPLETAGQRVVRTTLGQVTAQWAAAETLVVDVPDRAELGGTPLEASIQRGRELFHGQIANCVGCHGPEGGGGAVTVDFDDWTKEYSTRLGLTPTDRDQMRPFKNAGAPTPRVAKPRTLSSGVFRGGGDNATLYRRITQGIAGSPMPGVAVVDHPDGRGLTPDQIHDLVRYVQSVAGRLPMVQRAP